MKLVYAPQFNQASYPLLGSSSWVELDTQVGLFQKHLSPPPLSQVIHCSQVFSNRVPRTLDKGAFQEFTVNGSPPGPRASRIRILLVLLFPPLKPSPARWPPECSFISHLAVKPTFRVLLLSVFRTRVEPGSGAWVVGCLGSAQLEFPPILRTVYFSSEYIQCKLSQLLSERDNDILVQ